MLLGSTVEGKYRVEYIDGDHEWITWMRPLIGCSSMTPLEAGRFQCGCRPASRKAK